MDKNTPKSLGFVMPAEWEKHSAVWLAWPYDETTFPKRMPIAEAVFVEMIKAIYKSEIVKLLVLNDKMKNRAGALLEKAGVDIEKINFIITKFADVWTRDYGPIFLVNRPKESLAWIKWEYNAYGKSRDPYFTPVLIDKDVFNNIILPGKKFTPGIVLEGGAIEVNGKGTLITTEQCLLNPNRNPKLDRQQIENYLNDYLGTSKIIWLKNGLVNDHTDGHIDDIAKFVNPTTILCSYEEDENDENFKILDDNYKTLEQTTDQDGKKFNLIKLPMPHMFYDDGENHKNQKAPVSYCNFYIGNNVVLAPKFNDPNDAKALKIIQSCFPNRKVVSINCSEIIYGGGTIHCMTQQEPAT